MSQINKLLGIKFNRYTIIKEAPTKGRAKMVLAKCDCGTEKVVNFQAIKSGKTKSCGCYKIDMHGTYALRHGLFYTPLYTVWSGAKGRCLTITDRSYHHYGGRGITFYEGWKHDYRAFYEWAMQNGWRKGLHLDRIDNDRGYSPDNCRFVTSKVNCRNKSNNVLIQYDGKTKTITEWSEIKGICYASIWYRHKRGWSAEKIFNTPVQIQIKTKKTI